MCLSDDCKSENNHIFVIGTLNGLKIVNEDYFNDLGVRNDLEAARKVYNLYPYWKYCDEQLFVFDNSTGLWKMMK